MFAKKNRITSAEFKTLGQPIRTENQPGYTLRFYHLKDAVAPKCAVVVSKKTARSAVARNRIRRRLAAELTQRILALSGGMAVVAYAKA